MPVPALVIVEMPSLEGIARASEQELMDLTRRWARARRTIDAGLAMLAGQIAARSTPELGYDGMAQRSGARTPDALVAQLTGTTAAEAGSLAAMGRIMEEHAPWLAPVVSEVAGGRMSVASADAIRRGLGSPGADVAPDDLIDAARSLVDEVAAEGLSPERLGRRAREARDELDAAGVADRERRLRERRSLRLIPQSDGMTRIAGLLDPESAAIVTAAVDQVTSPRRGGPRFVGSAERARTQLLADDERSTEQLALDALVDMVRIAGAADEGRLLGARQPTVHIHVDAAQRAALAARWGGCAVDRCERPPSWTEAHHIREWQRDHGATDVANGILLCRHHHLLLHNNGWRIRHRGPELVMLPPPCDAITQEIPLRSKNPVFRQRMEHGRRAAQERSVL